MRALVLEPGAERPVLRELPVPVPRRGEVRVRISKAFLAPFMSALFDGDDAFVTPARPFVPGMDAIGTVDAVGEAVWDFAAGERVYCDAYFAGPVGSGAQGDSSDRRCFLGNFAVGADAAPVLAMWPDGAFAEYLVLPAAQLVPVGADTAVDDALLTLLGWLGTAYAGAVQFPFSSGSRWAVPGATGLLGASAVNVLLALGAGKVFVSGRHRGALAALAAIDERIEVVAQFDPQHNVQRALYCQDGADPARFQAVLAGLQRGGAISLVSTPGAVAALDLDALVYGETAVAGSLWFRRRHLDALLALLRSAALQLDLFSPRVYGLEAIDAAVDALSDRTRPFAPVVFDCLE